MRNGPRNPVILVANNPFGHHLLTSQLLNLYREMRLDAKIILLCNGVLANTDSGAVAPIEVVSFAGRQGGVSSYIRLLAQLIHLRWRYPRAAYHLRGFVAGSLFWLSRLGAMGGSRYIYDPRGAFFIEWRESGRAKAVSRLFGWIESRLIRGSVATIVTSGRFGRLYRRLFGRGEKYVTIYNSTSFAFTGAGKVLPAEGAIRFVYLGTFNHWHDMDELVRIMGEAARQLGPGRVAISVYTLPRFHAVAREKFGAIDCAELDIRYVGYEDIPHALADKHVGVSVVRPALSSRIASPIKVSDYVALGLVPLMNSGIGDFDPHFRRNQAAVLYRFAGPVDMSCLKAVRTAPNRKIHELVSHAEARARLAPIVERMRNG